VPIGHYREALAPMISGDYEEDTRAMLESEVWRDGERIFEGLSMNDVVVSRGATASMVELRVDIGDEFVANIRADGLIVASPTGSTAYALSAGGPILHPGIAGWVVVPIASHTMSNRPIVLPDTGVIRITVVAGRDASANFDMQALASLLHGDQVRVRRSAHKVRFLHPRGWSYYATLRRKLRWYEGVV
jgi:NAD+ kinase